MLSIVQIKVSRAACHALNSGLSALTYSIHVGKIAAASQVVPLTIVVITRVVDSLIVVTLHAMRPLALLFSQQKQGQSGVNFTSGIYSRVPGCQDHLPSCQCHCCSCRCCSCPCCHHLQAIHQSFPGHFCPRCGMSRHSFFQAQQGQHVSPKLWSPTLLFPTL